MHKAFLLTVFVMIMGIGAIESIHEKIQHFNTREPHLPSYVDTNHLGLCLRASRDLEAGTVVATADMEECTTAYIAGHPDEEHKYVGLLTVSDKGVPTWGRIRGKWAFCNHSCDPTCQLQGMPAQVITRRAVKKGEELTTAYDAYIAQFPWPETWNFICLCGTLRCKKIINKYRHDIVDPISKSETTN